MAKEKQLQQLQHIEDKVRRLLSRYADVQQRLAKAQEEIQLLEGLVAEKEQQIKNFKIRRILLKL